MKKTRVAFVLGGVGWTGGINYYRNLLTAIKMTPNIDVQPVIFLGKKNDASEYESLGEVVQSSLFDKLSPLWCVSQIKRVSHHYFLYALLKKYEISLLSHNEWLWQGCDIPSLGWIPDFQHIHLPHFFSSKEIQKRDKADQNMFKQKTALLLSSEDALKDLNNLGEHPPAHILRFTSCLDVNGLELPNRETLKEAYGMTEPWFYIPNQFWKHKNHGVVIDALKCIKDDGKKPPLVVCSGDTRDYRNPDYFPMLIEKVKSADLEQDFLILGKIPYLHVMALMKFSMAVINPSLFEGWNTAVEEGKAMGKMIVLSDIAVHKEQCPERAFYFSPDKPRQLAECLLNVQNDFDVNIENENQLRATASRQNRIESFASRYASIVRKVKNQ